MLIAAATSPPRPRPAVRIGETGRGLTSLQVWQGLAALFKGIGGNDGRGRVGWMVPAGWFIFEVVCRLVQITR